MAKKNFYAVRVGKTPGIYSTWDECKDVVSGYPKAEYKGFSTKVEAEEYLGLEKSENIEKKDKKALPESNKLSLDLINEVKKNDSFDLDSNCAYAYVDGSYNEATCEFSCGVVFFTKEQEYHFKKIGEDSSVASMRNVAGEILGARLAMEKALELGIKKLTIFHDYEGIAKWCLGLWKTNKEGTIAYKLYYDSIKALIDIEFVKVKGHSGNTYNDLADELASLAFLQKYS